MLPLRPHTHRERAIYRYVHSWNDPMHPSLPIPYAPPTCFTQPHLPSPHPSTPCLHQPVPAHHSWHHLARQVQPSIPTLPAHPPGPPGPPGPPCPLLPPGPSGPARPGLPCPAAPTQPDPSLLRAAQMRHPLRSCWQCCRFLLKLFVSVLATMSKKVAIAEDPPKIVAIAGKFAFLPEHALFLDQHPRCLWYVQY